MKKALFFSLIVISNCLNGQKMSIGFYNVENLFDTINDPSKNDEEFLPEGKMQWNSTRYNEKLAHINKVMNEMGPILLLGMCEVENQTVVRDVVHFSTYKTTHGVVHFDASDERGIDVSLIYDSIRLKLIQKGQIRFILPGQEKATSRDIGWAKFTYKKDTLFAMVNHWPSRRGGQDESEKNRLEAAKNARLFIDSLEKVNPSYKLVFMGDLNDYPEDKAPKLIAEKLKPMICKESGEFGGSYLHDGEWNVLDHIMVSPSFHGKKKFKAVIGSGKILSPAYLIEEYKGKKQPFRTYVGSNKYLGGYSDHLPVKIEVQL